MAVSLSSHLYVVMSYTTPILVMVDNRYFLNTTKYSTTTSMIQNACKKAFPEWEGRTADQIKIILAMLGLCQPEPIPF